MCTTIQLKVHPAEKANAKVRKQVIKKKDYLILSKLASFCRSVNGKKVMRM